ncbi:Stk1 family PASTA domain-containing Ser/Thr kinase [Streptomyces tsukubensis]|uniref:Stk1 family PASTA domain-containing Ser/Thr kinase n=1 Tax=Streptomyces tsukubensis TaxID=83656 RepID=UPI00344B8D02
MSQDGAQGHHVGGSVANGRYLLRDLLGQGGMASVHLGYDTVLDRQVAIKTLHTELGREQSFRERFRREAQAVAKLSHTNIVSVFDTGEDELGGTLVPYIVMEYVEGRPLGAVLQEDIRQYGAMPADRALKVAADVLAALESSHENGLVHRDIKPGNVMLTRRGVVKVMDFGIARAVQSGVTSMTQTGMVVGTPQYLSPEQALGRAVDARSDLYSVGIMLFQLLTGRLPFDADSPLAIAYAHVQEEPVAPSTVNRSVNPATDALVLRALKKNPNERFRSADAMRNECLRVAAGGQTAAPSVISGPGGGGSGAGVGAAVYPPHAPSPHTPPHTPPHAAPQHGQGHGPGHAPVSPPHPHMAPHPRQQPPHSPAHGIARAPYQQQPGPQGPYGPRGHGPGTPPPQQGMAPPPYGYPQRGGAGMGAHVPPPYASPPTPRPAPVMQHRPGPPAPKGTSRGRKVVLGIVCLFSAFIAINFGIGFIGSMLDRDSPDVEVVKTPAGSTGSGDRGTETGTETGTGTDSGSGKSTEPIPPDRTRTINDEKCSEAREDSSDPSKVDAPSLLYKDLLSVKDCLRAAGWTWKVTEVDNPQYPKDAVVGQFPSAGSPVSERQQFELTVSTGKAG